MKRFIFSLLFLLTANLFAQYPSYFEINTTYSQMQNMGTTRIAVLDTPGVNKYWDIELVIIEFTPGTVYSFSGITDYITLFNGDYVLKNIAPVFILEASIKKVIIARDFSANINNPDLSYTQNFDSERYLNTSVSLGTFSGTNSFSSGTGTFKIKIYAWKRTWG